MKYNKNLLHLDLSYTRLSSLSIKEIGSTLKKAKSLLAIHFSGNPGINNEVKEYIRDRIKCKINLELNQSN